MRAGLRPLVAAATLVLAADLLTKAWASSVLPRHEPVLLLGNGFRLVHGLNRGVAFGLLAGGGGFVLVLTGSLILGLALWLIRALRAGTLARRPAWAGGALLGGAVANFVDRLADGAVTDFLDLGIGSARWPTFNLADTAIVLGALGLVLLTDHSRPPTEHHG